jgi:hypothetical protein
MSGKWPRVLLVGLSAFAMHVPPYSFVSAASYTGALAGRGSILPSSRLPAGEPSMTQPDDDSLHEKISLHLGQLDDLISHMSKFQVRLRAPASVFKILGFQILKIRPLYHYCAQVQSRPGRRRLTAE